MLEKFILSTVTARSLYLLTRGIRPEKLDKKRVSKLASRSFKFHLWVLEGLGHKGPSEMQTGYAYFK